MKHIYCLLLSVYCCISFTVSAQIEVKTINPDDTPNSNCYFSVDSVQIGLTNRNGSVFIDQCFKGEEVVVTDIDTDWEDRFYLNKDTTIVVEDVQTLSEIEIKPRNTKKLYKEIMELNQNQLPEKLNLKGELFLTKLYIINDLKSEERVDTVVDFFKCDIVILDVFGSKTILAKNPRKFREGYAENEEYFSKVESLSTQFYDFHESFSEFLNFERFQMNKFRKYRSVFDIDEDTRELKFIKKDTTHLLAKSVKSEFLYVWDKKDSLLNRLSRFSEIRGKGSSTVLNIPFAFTEYSNFNHDYSNSHVLSERELTLYVEEYNKYVVNNIFSYFYIEKEVKTVMNSGDYIEVESLQSLFEETKQKKRDKDFVPILYPLRYPVSIFFD